MGGDRERLQIQKFTEHYFENISSHQQLEPDLVQGIIKCVHASGMRTTDEDVLDHIQGDVVIWSIDSYLSEISQLFYCCLSYNCWYFRTGYNSVIKKM
jgi:hypothetical protein